MGCKSKGRSGKRVIVAMAVAVVCSIMATTVTADKKDPPAPVIHRYATDAEVVAAMKSGIDFLLSSKNAQGHWDGASNWPGENHAGETSLVLYALLHAGHSLQDDLVYQQKLSWRNKETIGPAVEWLT